MPFFLATASPSFSALTICCGLAGATGATKAPAPESSSSERNWQRMIYIRSGSRAAVVPRSLRNSPLSP